MTIMIGLMRIRQNNFWHAKEKTLITVRFKRLIKKSELLNENICGNAIRREFGFASVPVFLNSVSDMRNKFKW